MQRVFDTLMQKLWDRSKTAKLWLAYVEYVDALKLFIHTERTRDWNLHLVVFGKMLNLFVATGHFSHAKSCLTLFAMDARAATKASLVV